MQIVDLLLDRNIQIGALSGVAAAASVLSFASGFFQKNPMQDRLKRVNDHKEELRQKHRDSLKGGMGGNLRTTADKGATKSIVEQLKLFEVFDAKSAAQKLSMAGMRGEKPVFTFMLMRVLMPIVIGIGAIIYFYILKAEDHGNLMKLMGSVGGFAAGFYLPNVYVKNMITKRQEKVQLAWPDALDLLLICVEAGMSIEAAFQKVGEEVGASSPELAEELGLTTAELSYLAERKQAYINLGDRTGLEGVKSVVTALIQSEQYGTPLGSSLRVMAAENREMRMQAAEKKAAALPPKLTVPMMIFNLPVLFIVILTPAVLRVYGIA